MKCWLNIIKERNLLILNFKKYWKHQYILEKYFNSWKNNLYLNHLNKIKLERQYFLLWKKDHKSHKIYYKLAINYNNKVLLRKYFVIWRKCRYNQIMKYKIHKAEIYYQIKKERKLFNLWRKYTYVSNINRTIKKVMKRKLYELYFIRWKYYYLDEKKKKENYRKSLIFALHNYERRERYPLLKSKIHEYLDYWKRWTIAKKYLN